MNWVGTLLSSITAIGGKMVLDRDKQAEFAFKSLEMAHELALKLLDTPSYKWVDALVKIAYASESLIKGLFRPLASALLIGYSLMNPDIIDKLHNMGPVGDAVLVAIFGSFPGWMASRHAEKKREQ